MIEQIEGLPAGTLGFRASGQVTAADYERVLVPDIEAAFVLHRKLRLLYHVGPDFTGFDPGAMWEDFKVGIEHLTRWERVAVVTDVEWIGKAVRFFAFLLPATTKLFSRDEAAQARAWIST